MRPDIDLRPLLGPDVLDQGPRPTCVAFASSAAHEAVYQSADPDAHLAPEALWWQAVAAGHASNAGMILDHVGPSLNGHGQPTLLVWPYNSMLGAGTEDPPAGVVSPPWQRAQLRAIPLKQDGVEDLIEEELAQSRPVILVVEVTDEFYVPDSAGIVQVPDLRTVAGGYHAVVCVGAASHPALGRLLLIKNSWGTAWGLGGYCWLPVEYLIAFAVQAAAVDQNGGTIT